MKKKWTMAVMYAAVALAMAAPAVASSAPASGAAGVHQPVRPVAVDVGVVTAQVE